MDYVHLISSVFLDKLVTKYLSDCLANESAKPAQADVSTEPYIFILQSRDSIKSQPMPVLHKRKKKLNQCEFA